MKTAQVALGLTLTLILGASAHAGTFNYSVAFDGPSEFPPNASPAIGTGTALFDDVANTLTLHADFSGLLGTTTASHIHAPTTVAGTGTAGVATTTPSFAGFPLGVTSGTFDSVLDLLDASSFNPAYVTANGGTAASAESALMTAFLDGKAYWNIHSTVFPGGEIRGFLTPAEVPEPAGTAAISLGIIGAVTALRRWRNRNGR